MARTSKDHAEIVLSAILPDRRDLLDRAIRDLTIDHFSDSTHILIFSLLEKYLNISHAVLSVHALKDSLSRSGKNAGETLALVETFELLSAKEHSEAEFNWSIHQLKEIRAEKATEKALTESMAILKGAIDSTGKEIKGHEAARQHLLFKITEIDRDVRVEDAPEGDIRSEYDDIMRDYNIRKSLREQGASEGILFGIPKLDESVGGLERGTLSLMAAYAHTGKTQLCVQLAWSAAIEQGRNFLFYTTETVRDQVRRRMVSRHSKHPKFGSALGLDSVKLAKGNFDREEELLLDAVVKDLADKKNEYGRCEIVQVPRGSSMTYIETRSTAHQRQFNIDLIIMDYLALLSPDRNRGTIREEQLNVIKEAKQFAVTFNRGLGVPFVSPWQTGRASLDDANKVGRYTLSAMAETAEAERSSDVIVSLLGPTEKDGSFIAVKGQLLKNREGITDSSIPMYLDLTTSHFSDASGSGGLDNLFN